MIGELEYLRDWEEGEESDEQRAKQVKRYKKEERANQRDGAFLVRIELLNPNRSLDRYSAVH